MVFCSDIQYVSFLRSIDVLYAIVGKNKAVMLFENHDFSCSCWLRYSTALWKELTSGAEDVSRSMCWLARGYSWFLLAACSRHVWLLLVGSLAACSRLLVGSLAASPGFPPRGSSRVPSSRLLPSRFARGSSPRVLLAARLVRGAAQLVHGSSRRVLLAARLVRGSSSRLVRGFLRRLFHGGFNLWVWAFVRTYEISWAAVGLRIGRVSLGVEIICATMRHILVT
jgi:hypothetical protein